MFYTGTHTLSLPVALALVVCPALASTTSASNAVGMGLAATFVLVGSNVVISLLRNIIPDKIRIPAFVVIICTFVTLVEMLVKAFVPALYASLGMFIPLIVVNCIILARAEAFASKNGVLLSAADGLGMGAGFTLAITVIGIIRELLGNGSVFGLSLFGEGFEPMLLSIMAPGGFLVFGLVLGVANYFMNKAEKKKTEEESDDKASDDDKSG